LVADTTRTLVAATPPTLDRIYGHPDFAYFTDGQRMIAVEAHLCREVKSDGKPRLSLRQKSAQAGIGLRR
jgi:hypothetical protein